jgi:tetratricopeptide (TPR) repeat protein
LESYNLIELGDFIAKRRKELGMRQIDLADEHISISYISNVENGHFQATKDKLVRLCRKLNLTLEELDNSLEMQERDKIPASDEKIKLELFAIEDDMDSECVENGFSQLRSIEENLSNNDPLITIVHYLKGKYFIEKGKWKQAIAQYSQSIQKLQLHEILRGSNIESANYCSLSRISYFLGNLQQAIYYTRKGLESFVPHGERDYIQHYLLISQVVYLSKLDQTEEANRVLDSMWEQMDRIKSSQVILNMYEMKAYLLNKARKYSEAISVGMIGLELARLDNAYERKFELWTTLGTSFIKTNKLEEAKRCFQSADKLTKKVKNEHLFIRTKTQLGLLYLREDNFELATSTLEVAVNLGKKTKDNYRLYEASIALGDCYLKQKNFGAARKHYELALKYARELSFEKQEPIVLLRILKCTEKTDRTLHDHYTNQFIQISMKLSIGGENTMLESQVENPQINREGEPPPP